jgi:hypothetical protein
MCAHGAAQEQVPAVWKEREFVFSYRSSIAIYACTSLESRVASILRAIGARPDLQVKLSNCRETTRPPGPPVSDPVNAPVSVPGSRNARGSLSTSALDRRTSVEQNVNVLVRLSMPVEVTPDVVDELKRDKSRRELVSHVTGDPAPRFDDPIVFAAERRVVTLSRDTIGIEPEECELLDQISASGFRELGIRVVSRDFVCDRNRVSLIAPRLDVEALLVASHETDDDRRAPPAGGVEADPGAPAASDEDPAEPAAEKPPE